MTNLFLCILVLSAPSILWAALYRRRYEETLPVTVFSTILLLFVFGLANCLRVGFYAVAALWGAMGIAGVWLTFSRSQLRAVLRLLFTPAFFLYAGLIALIALASKDLMLTQWDEFSHWGRVAKTTFLTDKISLYTPYDLIYRSYPPALSLLQYFVLSLRPQWNEAVLYYCQALLAFALFLPFLRRAQWKHTASILTVLSLLAAPLCFFPDFYYSLYMDGLMALLFGYCLAEAYQYETRDVFALLRFCCAMCVLTLTKDTGAYLAAVACCALLCRLLPWRVGSTDLPATAHPGRFAPLLLLLLPLGVAALWQLAVRSTQTAAAFNTPMDWAELPRLWAGEGAPYRQQVLRNFAKALLSRRVLGWIVSVCALPVAFLWVQKDQWRIHLRIGLVIAIGFSGYTLGLLGSYLFSFREMEAVPLASFDRYFFTYLQGLLYAAVLLSAAWCCAPHARGVRAHMLRGVVTVMLLIAVPLAAFVHTLDPRKASNARAYRAPYQAVARMVENLSPSPDSRIWLIGQLTRGVPYIVMSYELATHPFNPKETWSLGSPQPESSAIWSKDYSAEAWAAQLKDYDLVLLFGSLDKEFYTRYAPLFGGEENIHPDALYAVESLESGVSLRLLGAQ